MRLLAGKHFDSTFGLYENNMIIYNPGQKPVEVSKISSNLDILPTLSNLFGLPYDSRLFIGHDGFSDADDISKVFATVEETFVPNAHKGTEIRFYLIDANSFTAQMRGVISGFHGYARILRLSLHQTMKEQGRFV